MTNIRTALTSAGPELQRAAADGTIPQNAVDEQVLTALQGGGGGVLSSVQDDSSVISRMSDLVAHPFQVGFADSMSLVLLGGGVVMLLAFLILNLLPAVELRSTSASAAARAEGQAAAPAVATPGAHRAEADLDGGAPPVARGRHVAE